MMFSQKQLKRSDKVLMQLDNCNSNFMFPFLDNGNVYLADTRMSVYANSSNWAIIIEVVGYNPRAWQTDGFDNCLYCYGNHLTKKPGIDNDNFLFPIGNGTSEPLFRKGESEIINPFATDLKISKNIVSVINDSMIYSRNGITLKVPPSIFGAIP